MAIENLFRYPALAVGLMAIENLFRYTELAVGLKPSAMQGKARLRGLYRIISSKTISPRLCKAKPACAGWRIIYSKSIISVYTPPETDVSCDTTYLRNAAGFLMPETGGTQGCAGETYLCPVLTVTDVSWGAGLLFWSRTTGSVIVKVVPSPTRDATLMAPLCASMIAFAIARPKPALWCPPSRLRDGSARAFGGTETVDNLPANPPPFNPHGEKGEFGRPDA